MKAFFSAIIFQPLYNALIALYLVIPDFGVAIILLTLIIRFLLLPISRKSIESQKKMQEIQPQLKKIQQKYKHDKQLQGQKIMEFYRQNKINPASGCLPLIVQLIILIALYRVFMLGLGEVDTSLLYGFVKNPGQPNPLSLGLFDLSQPNIPLTIVAAFLTFVQGKMMTFRKETQKKIQQQKKEGEEPDFSTIMQQQMVYMSPVITLFIGFKFPSGLIVYWITTTLFMIIQQYQILKKDGWKFSQLFSKS